MDFLLNPLSLISQHTQQSVTIVTSYKGSTRFLLPIPDRGTISAIAWRAFIILFTVELEGPWVLSNLHLSTPSFGCTIPKSTDFPMNGPSGKGFGRLILQVRFQVNVRLLADNCYRFNPLSERTKRGLEISCSQGSQHFQLQKSSFLPIH